MSLLDKIFEQLGGQAAPGAPAPAADSADLEPKVDPYADGQALVQRVQEHIKECSRSRWAFERLWFRGVLYYLGNQWLSWDGRTRRWRERKLRKWVPKPVTNRFASTVDSIVAAIQATKVMPSAWPATDDPEDIGSANVADRVLEVISSEIKSERVRQQLAKWIVLCGDAFAYIHYDREDTSLGFVKIPSLKCQMCQKVAQPLEFEQGCPGCGAQGDFVKTDQSEQYPVGKMCCDVLSPLQVYVNMDIPDLSKHTKFAISQATTKAALVQRYGKIAEKVSADTSGATQTAQYFMQALAYAVEDLGPNLAGAAQKDRVTVYKYCELPSPEFPEGIFCVVTSDDTVLEAGPMQEYDETADGRQYYLPLVKIGYEQVPGRIYSKTPAADLLSKQDQLNRLESLIELSVMKGVYGTWLLPTGSSISNIAGEPAQVIRWTPTGTGGAKPEVVTTAPFPPILLEWKNSIQADFEELGGTFDAMKGNVPRGVSAGYAIQLLTERSYGRFASVFTEWELGWTELYQLSLKMFRTYASEPRLRKIKGASGSWEIQAFKNSDLKGSVDLQVEGGASKPRSKLAEQALVETLAKLGVLNVQDPEQRYQVATMFGMGSILGAQDEDIRHAAAEWDALLKWEPPLDVEGNPLPSPDGAPFPPGGPEADEIFDNHVVHVSEHRKPTRSDVWKTLPPWKKLFWKNHTLTHLIALQPPVDGMSQKTKPEGGEMSDEPGVASKSAEQGDKTMATLRSGGSNTLGAGGKNQY